MGDDWARRAFIPAFSHKGFAGAGFGVRGDNRPSRYPGAAAAGRAAVGRRAAPDEGAVRNLDRLSRRRSRIRRGRLWFRTARGRVIWTESRQDAAWSVAGLGESGNIRLGSAWRASRGFAVFYASKTPESRAIPGPPEAGFSATPPPQAFHGKNAGMSARRAIRPLANFALPNQAYLNPPTCNIMKANENNPKSKIRLEKTCPIP